MNFCTRETNTAELVGENTNQKAADGSHHIIRPILTCDIHGGRCAVPRTSQAATGWETSTEQEDHVGGGCFTERVTMKLLLLCDNKT